MSRKKPFGAAFVAAIALAISIAGAATAGSPPPPDKSGGTDRERPVTLKLLNANDADMASVPAVQRFIERVRELSKGAVTIELRQPNDGRAGEEQRVVRDVMADKDQLAWVGSRVWDTFGVNTFRALDAPMLIDSYALESAVLRSELPAKMLAGLDGHAVVGLALLGDNLRHPAAKRPLRGPADFEGLRILTYRSATEAAAFRALGARPSYAGWAQRSAAFRAGRLDSMEIDLYTYEANAYAGFTPYLTLNVALWPRTAVLFANAAALDGLSDRQRGWIRQAADDAARYSLTTFGEDARILPLECRNGMRAVFASPAQLSALREAFSPVYALLRKDPATARMIDEITALKRGVKADTPLPVGARCRARTTASAVDNASFPDGVYRAKINHDDVLRSWPDANNDAFRTLTGIWTITFRNGSWTQVVSGGGEPKCRRADGRFSIQGRFLTVNLVDGHGCPTASPLPPPLKIRWSYDGKLLRFRLASSAPPFVHVLWEAVPFVRIH